MKYDIRSTPAHSGFTTIEALITIVVGAIFIITINALYITVVQSLSTARMHAVADDLAYSYLRKYAYAGATPTWFVCDNSNGSSNTNDVTKNSNASGQILEGGTLDASEVKLTSPVTYTVKALAIYGCGINNFNKPIRIEAVVTYGSGAKPVSHSTIVGY